MNLFLPFRGANHTLPTTEKKVEHHCPPAKVTWMHLFFNCWKSRPAAFSLHPSYLSPIADRYHWQQIARNGILDFLLIYKLKYPLGQGIPKGLSRPEIFK